MKHILQGPKVPRVLGHTRFGCILNGDEVISSFFTNWVNLDSEFSSEWENVRFDYFSSQITLNKPGFILTINYRYIKKSKYWLYRLSILLILVQNFKQRILTSHNKIKFLVTTG